jgi:hypothetical protein
MSAEVRVLCTKMCLTVGWGNYKSNRAVADSSSYAQCRLTDDRPYISRGHISLGAE